jgi:ketosteroid isomerase-like protein
MSSSNAELVQKMLAAYLNGDDDTLRAMIPPDGEIYGAPGILNSGTYRGFEGFQEWIKQWEEAWDEVKYDLQEVIEVGDYVVVIPAHIVAKGAGSGVRTDNTFGWMYEFRDGKAVRFHTYLTVEEAMDAAKGLGEGP